MRNIILGWILALSGIGISLGGAFYHQSLNKNKVQKSSTGDAPLATANCPVSKNGSGDTLVASKVSLPMKKAHDAIEKVGSKSQPADMALKTADATPSSPMATMQPEVMESSMSPAPMVPEPDMAPKAPAAMAAVKKSIIIYFNKGSLRLENEYYADLKTLVQDRADFLFRIDVRSGERKTKSDNRSLARKRGRAIRDLLVAAGIPRKKIIYRVFPADPKKGSGNYNDRSWRRTRVTATPPKEK